MKAYYLSPSQFAISNIALRRLKIFRISELNDPFELMAMQVRDERDLATFKSLKRELNKNNGLLCFSRSWANPVLWGHYADRHTGVALGFDGDHSLFKAAIYAREPFHVAINPETNLPKPTEEEMERLLCTKFYDWKYEDEVRVFVKLDHSTLESGLYFYPFDSNLTLREVVLGPMCEIPIGRIRALVKDFDPPVAVIKASIAIGSFQVVNNVLATKADC